MSLTAPSLRPRHDGWTPERQGIFVAALAGGASIGQAAAAAGMSRRAAYRLRAHPAGAVVAAAWGRAAPRLTADLADAALDRGAAQAQATGRGARLDTTSLLRALARKSRVDP